MASTTRKPAGVAQGGMFNMPKAKFSKETQELLKVMMEESKLTNFQQRQLKQNLQSGECLPLQCHPTSSKPGRSRDPVCSNKKSHGRSNVPPKQQGLRSKDTIDKIVETSEFDESYRPHPIGRNFTEEKRKLQNMMTFGSEHEPPPVLSRMEEEEEVDRFEEVLGEIEERRQFLDDMAALGQDKPHRGRIMTEISQRICELEEIDKKKCGRIKLAS